MFGGKNFNSLMLRAPYKRRSGSNKQGIKKTFFNESSQCNAVVESSDGHKVYFCFIFYYKNSFMIFLNKF